MEQITRIQTETLRETIEVLKEEDSKVDEEALKREILNYLLDEESEFQV